MTIFLYFYNGDFSLHYFITLCPYVTNKIFSFSDEVRIGTRGLFISVNSMIRLVKVVVVLKVSITNL